MCKSVTSWFTHYWRNFVQRMQHAKDCGQRFPIKKQQLLTKLANASYLNVCVQLRYSGACLNICFVAVLFARLSG